jgi:hypothetical protein
MYGRFFCPAIVSPDLYGLRKKKGGALSRTQQRKLVLTAKVLQNIANNVVSCEKEEYLSDLSGFVEESTTRIRGWATQYLVRETIHSLLCRRSTSVIVGRSVD